MNRQDLAFGHFMSSVEWKRSLCNENYQSNTSLKRHHTEGHEQLRQRALQGSSSRAVVSSSSKQKNREKQMERVELWKCTKCEKRYEHKSSLKVHIIKVHEQPKPRPLPASKDRQGSNLKRRSEDKQGRKPTKVTKVAVRKTTKQVQNNTKNVTVNVVNNYLL